MKLSKADKASIRFQSHKMIEQAYADHGWHVDVFGRNHVATLDSLTSMKDLLIAAEHNFQWINQPDADVNRRI